MTLFGRLRRHHDGPRWSILLEGQRGPGLLTNADDRPAADVSLTGSAQTTAGTPTATWATLEPGDTVEFACVITLELDVPAFRVEWTDDTGTARSRLVRANR